MTEFNNNMSELTDEELELAAGGAGAKTNYTCTRVEADGGDKNKEL